MNNHLKKNRLKRIIDSDAFFALAMCVIILVAFLITLYFDKRKNDGMGDRIYTSETSKVYHSFYNDTITIVNKESGQIYEITMEEFIRQQQGEKRGR